uniref:NADH dehydrogenase subunit 6 n=1 Tax=Vescelia pieli TaxID=2526987 RepID=UPI0030FF3CEE
MFMILMMTLNMNFILMNHPLAMTMTIVSQTMLICLTMSFFSHSMWFSYLLFLIFLGGMLILFIYMTSLASNEMFQLPSKTTIMLLMLTSTILIFNYKYLFMFTSFSKQDSITSNFPILTSELPHNLIHLYNMPFLLITIMIMIYLLLTLIIAVNITQIQEGPLRQLS